MKTLFINAGHWQGDSGAVCDCGNPNRELESKLTMRVRDLLVPKLTNVMYIPDNLDLRGSIEWVNQRATWTDFAVDIHFNSNNNPAMRGTEAYYVTDPRYAEVFSRRVSHALGIPNRGPKPDSQSFVGELGWLRKLRCPSVLVECAYLSNEQDCKNVLAEGGLERIAQGITEAVRELFPVPEEPTVFYRRVFAWLLEKLKYFKRT